MSALWSPTARRCRSRVRGTSGLGLQVESALFARPMHRLTIEGHGHIDALRSLGVSTLLSYVYGTETVHASGVFLI